MLVSQRESDESNIPVLLTLVVKAKLVVYKCSL
jgi:hypothetical protein